MNEDEVHGRERKEVEKVRHFTSTNGTASKKRMTWEVRQFFCNSLCAAMIDTDTAIDNGPLSQRGCNGSIQDITSVHCRGFRPFLSRSHRVPDGTNLPLLHTRHIEVPRL